ncbi:MAG: tRNA (N6-threonylcarbamoyladenosine(37)-N6)-methyltransferase TrmO [Prevotella sp.]
MNIQPIAYFRSPLKSKFGVPRQSGIATRLEGRIVMEKEWNDPECLRGLEDFDYLWMIWGFSANVDAQKHTTVRPPRLGGNRRMGVFATRSSFRPNNLGMSAVKIISITTLPGSQVEIAVSGADLMDGTPIYDIKPYLPEFDAHPDVRGGFASKEKWEKLNVEIPDEIRKQLGEDATELLSQLLGEDPRPHYHDDPERVYGMTVDGYDVRFKVVENTAKVIHIDLF